MMNAAQGHAAANIENAPTDSSDGFLPLLIIVALLPLLLPFAMIAALGGSLTRLLYPAYILAGALTVLNWRRAWYPAFVLAVFAFAPFLRRVADFQAGFDLNNPILLAPYVALLPTLPSLFRQVTQRGTGPAWPFATIIGCITYGLALAMLQAPTPSNIFEAVKWLLPVSQCAWIMAQKCEEAAIRQAFVRAFLLILPTVTLYGIYQYVVAPFWDAAWMIALANATFGDPAPYKIRVFSMLNSPYSAAMYGVMGMLILVGEGVIGAAVALAAIPLVALTLVRSAWVGLAVGLLALFSMSRPTRKLSIIAISLATGLASVALMQNSLLSPQVSQVVTDRIDSFTRLGTDVSAGVREGVYAEFFQRLADAPFGEGFGVNLSSSSQAQKRTLDALDSGLLETLLTFGVFGGAAYFIAMGAMIGQTFATPSGGAGLFGAICCAVAAIPLGQIQAGEVGLVAWSAIGLLIAAASARRR